MEAMPLHDRVVIKRIEESQAVKGGIIIPDTANETWKSNAGRQAVTNGCEAGRPRTYREVCRDGDQD
jgi:co-chaperonin GroES (HSP10)